MDLLDLIIGLLLVAAAAAGWRRGLTWVSLSLLGLGLGIVLGAAVSGPAARLFAKHNPTNEALIATAIFLAVVAIIQGVGTGVGYRVRVAALRTRFAELDSGAGAVLALVGALAATWFLGRTFVQSPSARLDAQIQGSAIMRELDALFPRPPAFLNQLRQVIHDPNLGSPFSGLAPPDVGPLQIPPSADTPGIRRAAASVSKVVSAGCGVEAGSAWPMGGDLFVTNAHVVAGGESVTLEAPGGSEARPATVVLFDPQTDVAVLRVSDSGVAPLALGADPTRGQTGAVIGYPNGGRLSVVPAAVRGVIPASGDDIYGNQAVRRQIEVLSAQVIPGDSGGPLVDTSGRVVGLVFATSTTNGSEGYALSISQIAGDLHDAQGRTDAVSTQGCTV
ncbi:MAG TPA: MarP family serine protease [Candidatus Dormibacteraeota bacterium]